MQIFGASDFCSANLSAPECSVWSAAWWQSRLSAAAPDCVAGPAAGSTAPGRRSSTCAPFRRRAWLAWCRRGARYRWGSRTGRTWWWPWQCRYAATCVSCCPPCAPTRAASAPRWIFRPPWRTALAPRSWSFLRRRPTSWSSWFGPTAAPAASDPAKILWFALTSINHQPFEQLLPKKQRKSS